MQVDPTGSEDVDPLEQGLGNRQARDHAVDAYDRRLWNIEIGHIPEYPLSFP